MKRLLFLFAIMALTLSCGDDTIIEEEEKNEKNEKVFFEVNCFYTTKDNSNQMPDYQSKVYIYYVHHVDFLNFSYLEEGKVLRRDSVVVFPDQSGTIEANGKMIIQLERIDTCFSILIEDNYYKRITTYFYSEMTFSYLKYQENLIFTVIFNP